MARGEEAINRLGEQVAVVARALGIGWTNVARIVYVMDEPGDENGGLAKFGFAYGRLPAHVVRGEERFLIEWNRATDEVRFNILAFSRPRHLLARLGYPQVRRMQRRFGRDAARAMQRVAGWSLSARSLLLLHRFVPPAMQGNQIANCESPRFC